MRVYEATIHVGGDGRLRLDMPVTERDQDVHVAVVVEAQTRSADPSKRFQAAGISVPAAGSWSRRSVPRLKASGPLVSQTLVGERR